VSTIVLGLQQAITERATHPTAPVAASLILCLVRELGEAAAAATLALTLPYLPSIDGLGLASTEVGFPPEKFKQVYTAAGLLGLHKTAHAGEAVRRLYVCLALVCLVCTTTNQAGSVGCDLTRWLDLQHAVCKTASLERTAWGLPCPP
jgi:adenosine deaminase